MVLATELLSTELLSTELPWDFDAVQTEAQLVGWADKKATTAAHGRLKRCSLPARGFSG